MYLHKITSPASLANAKNDSFIEWIRGLKMAKKTILGFPNITFTFAEN
jgi:hypothetical protein